MAIYIVYLILEIIIYLIFFVKSIVSNSSYDLILLIINFSHLIIGTISINMIKRKTKNTIILNFGELIVYSISIILFYVYAILLLILTLKGGYLDFIYSIIIMILCTNIIYNYFHYKEDRVLKIYSIMKENGIFCVSLTDDEIDVEFYVKDIKDMEEDKYYKCIYNKKIKKVLDIKDNVIVIK